MNMDSNMTIISLPVHSISFQDGIEKVAMLGFSKTPSFVCFANVHMIVEAYKNPLLRQQLTHARLILADGKPVAKACQLLYKKKQERIAGMDFMPALLYYLNIKEKAKLFLLGSTDEVLLAIKEKISSLFPNINLVGTLSPPFRNLSSIEQQALTHQINESGANFVLVALGCPKQELWMAEHFSKIDAVMLGVGGAFPVFAGLQKRSPKWMQRYGLEWLYRLQQEPRRLFKRYLITNTLFLFLFLKQWLAVNSGNNGPA